MQKRRFRIGELAKQLSLEKFVIRFWEKEFGLKGTRSPGGQRFYTEKDVQRFAQIKELLYERGYTISGAKKQLKDKHTDKEATIIASSTTTFDVDEKSPEQINQHIQVLQKQLMKLRELL